MLIKIVKLLGALCPLEPRLAKKLSEPITNIISTTPAKSLLYECISTATTGMTQNKALMELCTEKLRGFVMEPDPNLKYLGLVGLCNVIQVYPRMISGHKDIILACLDDEDVTIRMRVLELLAGMASKKNLPDIVRKIRQHIDLSDGVYRDRLVSQLINTCSQDNYSFIADFDWYISTLVDLSHLRGLTHGKLISDQLIDVSVRVDSIRQFAVNKMLLLLRDPHILSESTTDASTQEVLFAAAFILGEFSTFVEDYNEALNALTQSRVAFLPSHVQGAYVQSAFKVLISGMQTAFDSDETEETKTNVVQQLASLFSEKLNMFTESIHVEVQERACFASVMIQNMTSSGIVNQDLVQALHGVFGDELNPVASKAQRKVRPPEGLDLESWIGEELQPEPETEEGQNNVFLLLGDGEASTQEGGTREVDLMPKLSKRELRRQEREQRRLKKLRKKDPFYLAGQLTAEEEPSQEEIPITELDLSHMDEPEKPSRKKGKKSKKDKGDNDDAPKPGVVVRSVVEEPEGDIFQPEKHGGVADILDIDISAPLRCDEVLPEISSYGFQTAQSMAPTESGRRKKKDKKTEKKTKGEKTEKREKRSKREVAEPEPASASNKKEKKTKKASKDTTAEDDLLFDLGATPPAAEMSKPGKKSKKSRSDKSLDKQPKKEKAVEMSNTPGDVYETQPSPLFKNEVISATVAFKVDTANPRQVCVPLVFRNTAGAVVSDVTVNITDTSNTKLVDTNATEPFALQPGKKSTKQLRFSSESFVRPQNINGVVAFKGPAGTGTLSFQIIIPCSAFVLPKAMSKDAYATAVTSPGCGSLSSVKLSVPPEKMKWAIEAMADILHVSMIECVSGAASFSGMTTTGQIVAALVKAKSSGLLLEVRSFDEDFTASLTTEASKAIMA